MNTNPYHPPEADTIHAVPRFQLRRKFGTGVFVIGIVTLAYGAVAFWIIPSLPPNELSTGRFNSLFVLGAGMIISLCGLAIRDTRVKSKSGANSPGSGISTSTGLLVLLIVVIVFIVGFSIANR
ncbi:hypothetical protein [Aureliella helgolandensis]|uniref:Uncharacterized protein n=1 Tax=Aureliella helgolandensis TaxID=2527968 RepID=A0A518GBE0_9BACT|nr:hypothetical protein [Aureliella helgolandensis]QDV25899.1 hypothetical protein Q31a_42270 [Aureliella helgolandensis]